MRNARGASTVMTVAVALLSALICFTAGFAVSACGSSSGDDGAKTEQQETAVESQAQSGSANDKGSVPETQEAKPNAGESTSAASGEKEEAEKAGDAEQVGADAAQVQEAKEAAAAQQAQEEAKARAKSLRKEIGIHDVSDSYQSLWHGKKGAKYQKYIVLHDTEGDGSAANVIKSWDNAGNYIAAHFVVNKDGSVWQCVPLDQIGHHSGFGDVGHNKEFGIKEDGRDDGRGKSSIGDDYPDYGMNSWSVGIEMVHVSNGSSYPKAQLEAVDKVIAYIDAYFQARGSENGGEIIDHKMWRTTNSDTSKEFSKYLKNYRNHRSYK